MLGESSRPARPSSGAAASLSSSASANELAADLQRKLQRLDALRARLEASCELRDVEPASLKQDARELKREHAQLGVLFDQAKRAASSAAIRKLMKDFETVLTPKTSRALALVAASSRASSSEPSSLPAASSREEEKMPQQAQSTQEREQEASFAREETASLKLVEKRSAALASLTSELATHVSLQGHDTQKLESQAQSSREDIVSGLSELAEQKKREAYKHVWRGTGVTAAIGGVVGIVGGPIGMALGAGAGAALGAAVGTGITRASRRSIAQELRDFKLKCQSEIAVDPASGRRVLTLEVFENQRWGFVGAAKGWSSENLSESFGDPTQWSQENLKELRDDMPAPFRPAAPSVFEGWKWLGPWTVDIASPEGDLGGWRYSFSFSEGNEWSSSSYTSSLVRRRRWTRTQIEEKPAAAPGPAPRAESNGRFSRADEDDLSSDAQRHIAASTRNVEAALDTTRATLDATLLQGIQIDGAARESAFVEDAAAHAQRVARAADVTGLLRNTFSFTPKKTSAPTAPATAAAPALSSGSREAESALASNEEMSSLDRISHLLERQRIATTHIYDNVESQNIQLDAMQHSLERGSGKIDKLLKMQQKQ